MSQKERIRAIFFREVELSAIEAHLIAGISLKSTLKRIHELRMQGVITKTNRFFQARGRKYAVYEMKVLPWWSMSIDKALELAKELKIMSNHLKTGRCLYGNYVPPKHTEAYM